MKHPHVPLLRLAAGLAALAAGSLCAAEKTAPPARPAWLTELSASAKLGYDTNVFATDNERATQALANREAFTATLAVKLTASLSALAGGPKELLVLGYAPTATRFDGLSSENNVAHRFTLQSAAKRGAWSWSVDHATTYIDGSRESLRYNCYNLYGMGFARERHEQLQNNGKAWLRYDGAAYFARATGSLLSHDFRTQLRNPTGTDAGWLNWVDRRDLNGGLDFGWRATKDFALVAGARLGNQHQDATQWAKKYSSNHYTRVLFGAEGKPTKWLSLAFLVGPDFRRYSAAGQYVTDRTPRAWTYEGSATATIDKDNSLTFAAKQERWLGSTGQSVYDNQNLSLTWKRRLAAAWSTQLTAQRQQGKYVAPSTRNDVLYSGVAQLQWAATKRLAVTLDYTMQHGDEFVGTTTTSGRGYWRNIVGAGARWAF